MTRILLICSLILSMSLSLSAQKMVKALKADKQLPSVELKTLDGETVNIKDYIKEDKLTVLSFWATWCSPCKKELDNINAFYEDWQEDYNMELIAITIDNQRSLSKVKPMVEGKRWDYTVLSDVNSDLKRALNFQTVPYTFIIDGKGNIVYSHSGYVEGDEYELEDKLEELSNK